MSRLVAATSDQVTVRPDEDLAFWNLVWAEDDWLRAEFDALVTREFPDRGDDARPTDPRWPGRPPGGRAVHPGAWRPHVAGAPVRRIPRQRSPPSSPHGPSIERRTIP